MEIEPDSLSKPLKRSEQAPASYEEVGFFSSFFFTWVLSAYRRSQQATLQPEDLLQAGQAESAEENRIRYSSTLLKTLFRKYRDPLIAGLFISICAGVADYTLPMYMTYLEGFLATEKTIWEGLASVAVLLCVLSLRIVLWRAIDWLERRLHLRMRTGLIGLVYSSILTATTSVATSEVVNELEVDVERVADGCLYFFWIASCLTELAVSLFVLVPAIGPASYIGLGLLVIVMVTNLLGANYGNGLYDRIMELKDERMKSSMELFSNIKMLKMAAWENALLKRTQEVRTAETGVLTKFMFVWSGMFFSLWATPMVATIATFSANKWLFGQSMSVETTFTTIAVFYILQGPLLWMPGSITWLLSSVSSSRRIDKFLRNEKVKDERVRHAGEQGSVQFVGASFSYSDDADPVLKDINLTIAPGEFVAIVGKVGSGKSSMVNALLGEMKTKSGSLAVNGSLAYTAALESWIQNATVKDNIVFGKTFDLNAYQNAIQASALHSDLELLPGGDQTEIGERGINLSGGQKARVSLARAVYQDCDVYLLDDPLSSVDAHVGSYIFHSCFLTALKGKTRVLVTHNTNFLNLVDRVIVMEAGSIAEIADYSHLRSDVVALEEAAPAALVKRDSSELIEVEDRRSGKVTLSVYFNYVQYSGGIGVYAICIVALVAWLGTRFLGDLSIKQWTQHSEEGDGYFHLYLMFGSIACVALLLRAVVLIVAGLKAATRIHLDMLERLVRAPINLFFDVTPLGRILNRLAKDQQIIEMDISSTLGTVMTAVGSGVGTMAVCVYFLPWVALVMPALVAFALYLQQVFLQLARETTRLEHVSRSPMVQQFTESVAGLKTMRCFGKQKEFTEKLKKLVETFGRATFTNSGIGTWLLVWMEIFSMCFVGIVVSYLIVAREEPAIAALVVTYMIPLGEAVNEFVCEFANLERAMISFERAHALTQIVQEEATVLGTDPHNWPTEGQIEFRKVCLKYRPNTPIVLKELSAVIRGKEKIGVVGRTGSGKSSLTLALFRIVELQRGHIIIDGVDTLTVGLHTLRKAMTMIPQDPVLFQGSLKYNLDPMETHTDEEVKNVMKDVGLSFELEKEVVEGGTNFSVGERQLMCIARAGLARPKILVLDEATSAIDHKSDSLIQQYIRSKFDCTVLTIAHRIHTILDSDRVLVLSQGRLVEFDTPKSLLANKSSAFFQLAQNLGLDSRKSS